MRRYLLSALLFTACTASSGSADSSVPIRDDEQVPTALVVRGEVVDDATDQSLPDATIRLDGKLFGRGSFRFEAPPDQDVQLLVEAEGYAPFPRRIRSHLDPRRERVLNAPIRLKRLATPTPVRPH